MRTILFCATLFMALPVRAFAQSGSLASCRVGVRLLTTGQEATDQTFTLNVALGDHKFSSEDLGKIDDKEFVAKIYGTSLSDGRTMTLEIRQPNGVMLPRAAASLYLNGRNHMLALIEGAYLLNFGCKSVIPD